MAQQTIGIGTVANDGTGDPARTAFDKSNQNFTELYARSLLSGTTANRLLKFAGTTGIPQQSASVSEDSSGNVTTSGNVTGAAFIPSGSTVPTNGMFLPASNTLAWAVNSTERMRMDSTGNVGIGVTASGAKLHVSGDFRTNNAAFGGSSIDSNVTMRAIVVQTDAAADKIGAQFSIFHAVTANNALNISGAEFLAQPQGSAVTVSGIHRGVYGQGNSALPTSGIASDLRGGQFNTTNGGAGTVTSAACMTGRILNSAAGVITAAHGLLFEDLFNSGSTITNTYAVKIGSLTSGTQTNAPFSIHSSDTGATMYHAGKIGVGSGNTAPTATLHVDGTIRGKTYTVATLPAAGTVGSSTGAAVSDSLTAYGSALLGTTLTGGGSNFAPVYSDGTNWRYG